MDESGNKLVHQAATHDELSARFDRLFSDPRSRQTTIEGFRFLREDFATLSGSRLEQLRRTVTQLTDVEQLVLSCRVLASRLVQRIAGFVENGLSKPNEMERDSDA